MIKTSKKDLNLSKVKESLHNNTERIVLETMGDLLTKPKFKNICTCHQCLVDIASYALNHLPAKYYASPKGELQTKILEFENQINVDTITAVTKAIQIVSNNPHHSS